MGIRAASAMLALIACVAVPALAQAAPVPTLKDAISHYENLEDEQARAELLALLAAQLTGHDAAVAHLYLGLLAFNSIHPEEARREFERALSEDATIEPPAGVSPKVRLAFAEAQQGLEQDLKRTTPSSSRTVAAPAAAVAIESEAPQSHSHVLAFTLGGAGLVAGGFAIYGLTQVLSFNSLVGQANQTPGSVDSAAFKPAQSSAQIWQPTAIVLTVLAGVGLVGAGLTW